MKLFAGLLAALLVTPVTEFRSAYVDKNSQIHGVTLKGRDIKLSRTGHHGLPVVAGDKRTLAWLIVDDVKTGEASRLEIYKDGQTRVIECEQLIRSFWFIGDGKQLAVDCGGRHFAGREYLYDVESLREIESFDQAEVPLQRRPGWATQQ